jgi:hypothetical protein
VRRRCTRLDGTNGSHFFGREATFVANDADELFDTPVACEETTEYQNRIEDEVEVEPEEDEELEQETASRGEWADIEQQFARYERNYKARRIREMTLAPVRKKRGARRAGSTATGVAA